jgi:hypothetical protein
MNAKAYNPKQKYSTRFTKIDNLLQKTAKEYHLESALYAYQVSKYWEKVLGEFFQDASNKTKITEFKKGVLTVACLCKELASEIKILAQRIIYALNKLLGRRVIYSIQVVI